MKDANVMRLFVAVAALMCAQPGHALNCSVSASPTSFGSYNTFSPTPLDGVGNVRVSCSNLISVLVSYTISLSAGAAGSYTPRQMSNGASTLSYNLYTSPAHTTVWGNGSAGTSTVIDGYLLGLLTVTRNYPVYGRVAAGQNVAAGAYTDAIVVTINY